VLAYPGCPETRPLNGCSNSAFKTTVVAVLIIFLQIFVGLTSYVMKRRPVEQKLTTVTKVFEYSCTTLYYVIRLVTLSEILFTNFGC